MKGCVCKDCTSPTCQGRGYEVAEAGGDHLHPEGEGQPVQPHHRDGQRGQQGVDAAVVDAEQHREGRHRRQAGGEDHGHLER